MYGRRWLRFSHQFKFLPTPMPTPTPTSTRSFCTKSSSSSSSRHIIPDERYRQLENLDMMTAAKMLFTDPPNKNKKFGTDFHLVQLFFACLPSLAVYLVAQYARYEMRKMEAEVEQKRKQKEQEEAEQNVKEMELNPPQEKEQKSDPQLLEVKMRLDQLEEAVKEIVVETKKQPSSNLAKSQVTDAEKKQPNSSAPSHTNNDSASNRALEGDRFSKHNSLKPRPELGQERKDSVATPNSSLQDPKGQNQGQGTGI